MMGSHNTCPYPGCKAAKAAGAALCAAHWKAVPVCERGELWNVWLVWEMDKARGLAALQAYQRHLVALLRQKQQDERPRLTLFDPLGGTYANVT